MSFEGLLEQLNVNVEKANIRFGGMLQILEKFVLRFPEDPTFGELEAAVADHSRHDENDETLERAVHTLKGLGANLGFDQLSSLAAKCLDRLRKRDDTHLQQDFEEIRKEYWRIVDVIQQYHG